MRQYFRDKQPSRFYLLLRSAFYIYIAALPLLAFWAFYSDKYYWNSFIYVGDYEDGISYLWNYLVVIFSFLSFFLSGIAALYFVLNVPIPANIFIAFFVFFDAPIQILVAYILNNDIQISELIILDYMTEIIGLFLGLMYLFAHKKFNNKLNIKLDNFSSMITLCLFVMISYYGYIIVEIIGANTFQDQIPIYTGIISTAFFNQKVVKKRGGLEALKASKEQGIMSKFAMFAMFALWLSFIVIIFL